MEQIFRIGDIVYHWNYGKGKVVKTNYAKFPVEVEFEGDSMEGITFSFTLDGRSNSSEFPSLSHTPYDFINGGFSQRKPLPNIKKGTPIFVRDYDGDTWYLRAFSHFNEKGEIYTFQNNVLTGDTLSWNMYSLENPINYEE